jgi:hypothetical protein
MPIKYLNGQPVECGDIVHVNNCAYYVMDMSENSEMVFLSKMDESREQWSSSLKSIGAYRDNVHPLFKDILGAIKP